MPRIVGIVVIIVVVGSPTGGIRASRRKRAAISRGALKAGRPRLRVAARARARRIPADRLPPPAADVYFVEIHRHGRNNPMAPVRTSKWTTVHNPI